MLEVKEGTLHMEKVKVGMWALPGLSFKKGQLPEALQKEMRKWSKQNHCGYWMTEELWSFKTEAQRDWWIMRWIDEIPRMDEDA